MKLLTKYLERAEQLESLALDELNQKLREALLKQASAYREMAAERARQLGLTPHRSSKSTT